MKSIRVLFALLIAVCCFTATSLVVTACGSDSSSNDATHQQELKDAAEKGAAEQRTKDQLKEQARRQKELEDKLEKLQKEKKDSNKSGGGTSSGGGSSSGGSSGGGSGGATACAGGVSLTGPTSCGFALNIAEAYRSSGPGTVTAYSPATNRTYYMNCSGSSPTVCSGGNTVGGATVYIP